MTATWPRRPRLVVGNWKMNKTSDEAAVLAGELAALARSESPCEIAVCPPYTALAAVGGVLGGGRIHWGAQNLHPEPHGAFTGEISGAMLVALGCRFVIVGHSERRHGMGESDEMVAARLRAARRESLTPIVCVGETLAERESDQTGQVLDRQVLAAYQGLTADQTASTVIAYEPVWAIGTGRVATPSQAREAHAVIRTALDRAVGPGAGSRTAILYGGSVNAQNAAALFAEQEIDGALVGGASLEAAGFWAIARAAAVPGAAR